MMETLTLVKKNILNLIYPLHCAACAKALEALNESGACRSCLSTIRRNPKSYYTVWGPKAHFDTAYSGYIYEGALKELIHSFKYKGRRALDRTLSGLLIEFALEHREITADIDFITCVPLSRERLKKRGFNQSAILALNLSKAICLPFREVLNKRRSTRPQNELSRGERLVNLSGAFAIQNNTAPIKNMGVLLIDDVMTTGATFDECAKVLKDNGARSVICLALAR